MSGELARTTSGELTTASRFLSHERQLVDHRLFHERRLVSSWTTASCSSSHERRLVRHRSTTPAYSLSVVSRQLSGLGVLRFPFTVGAFASYSS